MPILIVEAAWACALVQMAGRAKLAPRLAPVPARTPRREIRLVVIERFSEDLRHRMVV
jgi:hypothetical protein